MIRTVLLDLETTGLPIMAGYDQYPIYTSKRKYNTSRVVQIAAIILDLDTESPLQSKVIEKYNYIIKPDNFVIDNSHMHGITDEIANNGIPLPVAISHMRDNLNQCKLFVSHNTNFDANVLLSELYRYGLSDDVDLILNMKRFCTCVQTTNITKINLNGRYKRPKLSELYQFLYKREVDGQLHNAEYDVYILSKCFLRLLNQKLILPAALV